ncbi:hypothetical protein H6790_01660 [Candidatus Nomurabacteria bacterium]|nr:hypothetical protein [Candidatus Nomurabacteria bacterium]
MGDTPIVIIADKMFTEIKVKTIILWVSILIIIFSLFSITNTFGLIKNTNSESNARIGELLGNTEDQSTPGTLFSFSGSEIDEDNPITATDILYYTNQERIKYGLPQLVSNPKLSVSSKIKVDDMINLNYFDHVNPEGRGLAYFIEKGGYQYIVVGENLAMGDWKNAESVVDAWMNSEGHRANILSENFTEIGISVTYTKYEGKDVIIAVQHFGTPDNACPKVDRSLEVEINSQKSDIANMVEELDDLSQKIENGENQYIKEYNDLVSKYNKTSNDLQLNVSTYNNTVQVFNACRESFLD